MGREIRKVPKDWQHPKDEHGEFNPLSNGDNLNEYTADWDEANAKWAEGLSSDFSGGWEKIKDSYKDDTYEEYAGERPNPENYMPVWDKSEVTHIMMYEDCTEGTPISPAFKTPEGLARWLSDNGASALGSETATYDQWLATCRQGWVPSMVGGSGGFKSGVAASTD